MIYNKNLFRRVVRKLTDHEGTLDERHINDALSYIDSFWKTLIQEQKEDEGTLIGLPYPYVVPAALGHESFHFEEQYYWDSYFVSLALVDSEEYAHIAEGMLENLIYMFKRFHLNPTASRMYMTSRSQPPLLTSYIRLIYERRHKDLGWLKERMAVAREEYDKVWMSNRHPVWHEVHRGLSRYYDVNVLHDLAEAESGWDMTSRFERKCLDFLPVDLNSLLYKYEKDFAWLEELAGNKRDATRWHHKAAQRAGAMRRTMWHKRKHFFFDYNYLQNEKSDIWSLAGFFPLWAGLVTQAEANAIVLHLAKFEKDGGLATTMRPVLDTNNLFGSQKTQWAYPNGWAPLQWVVIKGLQNYDYPVLAERVARKWLHSNLVWFERHGDFLEKYNVVKPKRLPLEGVYPSQRGFGWTNAVFWALCKEFRLGKFKTTSEETVA